MNQTVKLSLNCKVGPAVISNDPNCQSANGKLMMEMLALHLVNATGLCKGLRTAAGRVGFML